MNQSTLCLNCGKRKAQVIQPYGALPCKTCLKKQRSYRAKEAIEITTEEIRESRKEYAPDIMQRYRGHVANKKYIKQYGTKGFTEEEIKSAKDVYPDYYKDE